MPELSSGVMLILALTVIARNFSHAFPTRAPGDANRMCPSSTRSSGACQWRGEEKVFVRAYLWSVPFPAILFLLS